MISCDQILWDRTHSVSALGPPEVHVWRIPLDSPPEAVAALESVLAPEEQRRQRSFRFARHARRFVVRRAALRHLLGRYIGCAPQEVQYATNPFGKLALAFPRSSLCFNLSHSHELAVAAFAWRHEVGVDVELVRPALAREDIAEQFFAHAEVRSLRRLAPEQQPKGFFRCWTSKEAYVKAIGRGLSLPLDLFEVSVDPDDAPRLLRVRGVVEEARRWQFRAVEVPHGYMATLALNGEQVPRLCEFDWSGGTVPGRSMRVVHTRIRTPRVSHRPVPCSRQASLESPRSHRADSARM